MMHLKTFVKFVPKKYLGCVQQIVMTQQSTYKRPSSTTATQSKSITECPKVTPLNVLLGYLPGGKFYKKDFVQFFNALIREKGNAVYMPGILGKSNYFLTQNPKDFEVVFRNEGSWPMRKGVELMDYHRNVQRKDYFGEKSGLLTTHGKPWGEFRNAVNPIVVHPKNVKIYLPVLSKLNTDFIERIKRIRDPHTYEVPGNFKEEIGRWTLESVAVVALDRQLGVLSGKNAEGLRINKNLLRYFEITIDLETKPSLWRFLPNRKFREVMKCLDEITGICEKYVNEAIEHIKARTTEKPESEQSILEKLLKVDEKIAKIMAMDLLIAAVDTTATTFAGLLLCLAKNPEKQEKLRQEVLTVLPHKESSLNAEKMKNMPYLRACLKESLRLYPLIPAILRTIPKDLELSGYRVPKGTEILMLFQNLLRDGKNYSKPNEFIPERWLRHPKQSSDKMESTTIDQCPYAASAVTEVATKSSNPFVYMPFGFGARSCIGRRVAEMELEIGIIRVIRNFQIDFNYPTENAFRALQINVPVIPLKFKFTDLPY